jgi:LPXTG-motif cell wall-anchored protein
MRKKGKMRQMIAGMMAAITLIGTVLSPVSTYAEASDTPPLYEDVKDQLDADEVVKAKDYELDFGSDFDAESDLTNIEIPDKNKVGVTLAEAKSSSGKSFDTTQAGTYKAVYYVEPLTTDHPKYRITRNLIVKEEVKAASENDGVSQASDDGNDDNGGSDDDAESQSESQNDDDLQSVEDVSETVEATESAETVDSTETEVKSEEDFDAEIEATESQDTYDEETGLDLSTVMETAVEDDVDFLGLEEGETIEFEIETTNLKGAARATTTETVSITRGDWYYYSSYGLGTLQTAPYYVKYGSISATAYCVQPTKKSPNDGTYSVKKLSDSKTLAKVCYYGTKASGDEGFFAEKHPDFSAGKRFVITHIAAAYANGSSDAFDGTNSTGKSLAMELYNYCVSQPEIPDVEMSFSNASVSAYIDGNSQRTEEVTFKADTLQTITFNLPDGVKLHNTTTGKTSAAGASVEISGGTKFYLSAPLTQSVDVSATFSAKMKGSITKDYSAYKISTGDTQDLAFVFGEGVTNEKYVNFSVTWVKDTTVKITKKDSSTGNAVAGAIYGVYSDKECKNLIVKMPATDANGESSVSFEKTQDTVYVKEITAPTGYLLDDTVYEIKVGLGETSKKTVSDDLVKATVNLIKKDKETGSVTQGDATFEGAVYGLYAREDIVHPDGKTGVLFKKDEQVAALTVDANGNASIGDLYLGRYYIKEITAPTGYLLDEEEHNVDCTYEGGNVATVERTVESSEQVIKQPFQLIKVANNGKTDADLLSGVGFSAYLVSSLKKNADGTYDFTNATPVVITEDGKTEMFTDEKGYALSIALPYGTYIVRETTTPHNYTPVDDFIVTITENNPTTPQVWRVLLDDEFEAKLKIVKKDAETGKSVLLANTEFKVYDLDNEKYVEQVTTYPKVVKHTSYFTDEEGYLILPKNLKIGNYRVEEVTAPNGYTINTNYVNVTVDSNTAYLTDTESGDAIITVEYENEPVKGKLSIVKEGNLKDGKVKLEGVVFELTAAEDIYTADHQKDENGDRIVSYKEGTIVATLTTDADGNATVDNLPLGKYSLKEISAPSGYVISEDSWDVEFVYADQNTAVIEQTLNIVNEPTKVNISKTDITGEQEIPGATLTILDKNDQVVETWTSTNEPHYIELLPTGTYTLHEEQAPYGYVIASDITFEVTETGEIQTVQMIDETAKGRVILNKADSKTGEPLEGVEFELRDSDGNVLETLKTDEAGHAESGLYEIASYVDGEYSEQLKYYLVETKALDGYELDTTEHEVVFDYVDDNTPVIEVTFDLTNDEEEVTEETTNTPVAASENPKTGDDTDLWIPVLLLAVSVSGITAIFFRKRRKNTK